MPSVRGRLCDFRRVVHAPLAAALAAITIVGFALVGAILSQSGDAEAELLVAVRELADVATEAVEDDRLSLNELTVLEEQTAELVGCGAQRCCRAR